MELKDKKILVVGAGRSGRSVTRFLAGKKARVTLTDAKGPGQLDSEVLKFASAGVHLVLGGYPQVDENKFELLVVSPGVPENISPIAAAKEKGIPVISELELAYRFSRAPIVAITGTNGKTTTTLLTGEIFKQAGYYTLVAGNIGRPLIEEVENYKPEDIIVAEVSSFQLEGTVDFRPRIAVVLNLTPDHLDRHGTFDAYAAAKARIFANQGSSDFAVLNYDDPGTRKMAVQCPGQVIFFSRTHSLNKGVFVREGQIMVKFNEKFLPVMPAAKLGIPGPHNLENALAAVAAAWVSGIDEKIIARALQTFRGAEHRLEFVRELDGVRYINDSKGTNPEAAIKALESFRAPIVLIAGGKNKGSDFGEFARKIKEKVRLVVLLGESAGLIAEAVSKEGFTKIVRAGTFIEAVRKAHEAARPGEVVLLSPACASWDMFESYEERGNLFKETVKKLETRRRE